MGNDREKVSLGAGKSDTRPSLLTRFWFSGLLLVAVEISRQGKEILPWSPEAG
jgi:hypothetical protein